MDTMKVAVVGCGRISNIYLKNMIKRFQITEVVACCDLNEHAAKEKADEYGIKTMTFEEILADQNIQVVVNLTTPIAHYGIIKKALEAGKHVYTEKVLDFDMERARELNQIARKKGLRLACAPDTFLGAAVQNSRKAVEQGLIGKVTSCHVAVNRGNQHLYSIMPNTSQPGVGIGFDVGIYYITALLSIFGPVDYVTGMVATNHPICIGEDPQKDNFSRQIEIQNENIMMACLKFKSGIYATMHFNGDSIWPEQPTMTVYGTEGILQLPNPDHFDGIPVLIKKGSVHSDKRVSLPGNYGFTENSRGIGVAEMCWAIRSNRPHRANADMACHAVEILNGIVKASSSGMKQQMQTTFEQLPGLPEGYLDDYLMRNAEIALI